MFSFSGSSIQLEGVALAEKGTVNTPFRQINRAAGGFSQVLSELQPGKGDLSLEQLAENPAMLEQLGISREHIQMFQKLMGDGKTLPEAAEAVLFDLKQQFADLLNLDPSAEQVAKIEVLQQEIAAILEILPEGLKDSISASMQFFRQAFDLVKQELTAEKTGQLSNNVAQQKDANAELKNTNLVSGGDVTEAENAEDILQQEAALASTMAVSQQQDIKHNKFPQKTVPASLSEAQNATARPDGARFSDNYGVQADAEYELSFENKPVVENKLMPNVTSQQVASRVTSLQINENAMSSQSMMKFSGEGSGSGMQSSSGGNASYTQLMTQTTPQPVTQNIHKPEWGNAIGQRITWMMGKKLQGAQLRITPAHLGPIDIKISIESGVAQVSFVSNHQVVRDALEQAVPRLRDMIEGQDLELGDVDISDRSLADSSRAHDDFSHIHENNNAAGPEDSENEETQTAVQIVGSDSLLDAYA